MGAFAAGQVVILPFPFVDLSGQKFRPAILIADAGRGDWVACQITSNAYTDMRAIEVLSDDFERGGLNRTSYVRPGKLFTSSESMYRGVAGMLRERKLIQVRDAIVELLRGEPGSAR